MSDVDEIEKMAEDDDGYSGPNPARYSKLCEPFDDHNEANAALKKFFAGVSKLREECGIPDVMVFLEILSGPEARRADATLYMGDQAHKLPMLARAYGAAREEHERNMGAFIEAGREDYRRRQR